jgi:hypothetical protein
LLSAIFNATIVALLLITPPPPQNEYDYIFIAISSIRTLLFLALTIVSEILRVRPISVLDEEAREPLKANGSTHYGTFDAGPTGPHSGRGGFGSNPPPTGGWVTYIRSFKVVVFAE